MRGLQQSSDDKRSETLLTVGLCVVDHKLFNGVADLCIIQYLCIHLDHLWCHLVRKTTALYSFEEVIVVITCLDGGSEVRLRDCA